MQKYIDEFIAFKRGGKLKASSARDYLASLNRFNMIVRKPLEEIDRSDIVKYRQTLELKYSPKSIEHDICILHAFVKFWNPEVKCISHERIEVPVARSNPHMTIQEADHRKMLSILGSTYNDTQKRLFINLLWDTGARCGEILSIDLDSIDFDARRIRIKTEKTKRDRVLFYGQDTRDTLCKLLPVRWEVKRSNALFIGFSNYREYNDRITHRQAQRWIRELCERAEITKKIVAHSYRHARIQRWISSGLSLVEVIYLSGHESIVSLEHYMRLGPAQVEERARKHL